MVTQRLLKLMVVVCCGLILAGCAAQPTAAPAPPPTAPPVAAAPMMTEAEARQVAQQSVCAQEGPLGQTAVYNEVTGTWWIDLAVERPGCAPACVVDASSKMVEVNWRCTGALPPAQPMTEDEARQIALQSDCAKEGPLGQNATFNDVTGTWWIDLAVERPGCAPACVVSVADKSAEVNWRCTGAVPALQPMTEDEARQIAMLSDCAKEGPLGQNAVFNDVTGTWWIDLAVERPGCAPACVVSLADRTAEVNWRCTGAGPITAPPQAPAPSTDLHRIQFGPGATTAMVQGNLAAGDGERWLLRVMAGQTMNARLFFTSGQAILTIQGADGTVLISDHAGATDWNGPVPITQDYIISVRNVAGFPTAYSLQVTVPPLPAPQPTVRRIQFAPGAVTATGQGTLAARAADRWVLKALAGQTMNVQLSFSTGYAILVIYGADGTVLISDHAGATNWSGPLPATQDYYIDVRNVTDAPLSYAVRVTVPPLPAPQPTTRRIQFAPGGTSATVGGQVAAGGVDRWVMGARAGQSMEVNLSGGGVVLVIYSAGGTVLISDHAGATSWAGVLPASGDYYIDVKSVGGSRYSLTVAIAPH